MAAKDKAEPKRIGRTVYTTHCIGSRYDPEQDKVVPFTYVLEGNIQDFERATRKLQRIFGTKRLMLTEMHHHQLYRSAPLEEFYKICDYESEKEID